MPVYQQVGDFEVTNVNGTLQKNGGNVASYFCTPDGYVIHAVLGPVSGEVLESEARWAAETWRQAQSGGRSRWQIAYYVAERHYHRIGEQPSLGGHGRNANRVHELFARQPLPALASVTQEVFEKLLGEHISNVGPTIQQAEAAMSLARRENRPVLLVVDHSEQTYQNFRQAWVNLPAGSSLRKVIPQFVVIAAPLKHLPALSNALQSDPEPYKLPSQLLPAFIILDPDGKQLDAFSGATEPDLFAARLGRGLADTYEKSCTPSQLRNTLRTLKSLERSASPLAQAEARTNWEKIRKLTSF